MSFTVTHNSELFTINLIPQNKAVDGDYIPRGRMINIGNLPVYEAPDHIDSRRLLIAVYDIFAFSNTNMMQVTDIMATQYNGFRAVLPDFFRGEYWDLSTPVT